MHPDKTNWLDNHPYWHITRFYIPLFIQAVSQSFTYPLVAGIVSHGEAGTNEYTAFAQAHTSMFLLGSIGGGLITTGMVFGTSKTGFANFHKLNLRLAATICALQLLFCIPPFDSFLFSGILQFNDAMADIARRTMLLSIPMQFCFVIRNKYLAALYSQKRSGLANSATIVRILATFLIAVAFGYFGIFGYAWGVAALSVPVILETVLSRRFSAPFIRGLVDTPSGEKASAMKQLYFTFPLAFGGMLFAASAFMIAIFLGRTPDSELSLSVHYIVMGLANPLGLGALRTQPTVIAFPPESDADTRMFKFAIGAGIALGLVALLAQLDSAAAWYFGKIQNLSPHGVACAKQAILWMALLPVLQSMRGYLEGIAALRRRPNAILAGQAMYLATMVSVLVMLQTTHLVPGYMMGTTSLLCALAMALVTVRIGIIRTDFEDSYGNPARRYEPDE